MKQYLKSTMKRYFVLLFFLSFSSIILTPDLHSFKDGLHIFLYRFNTFSIFSLLFSALSTVQTYESNHCNVAISMSGMHSFRIMRPILFFGLTLSLISLAFNQFFLKEALEALGKSVFLSSYKQQHHVYKTPDGTLFYKDDFKNITFVDTAKNILYAKSGKKQLDGFDLEYVDHFKNTDQGYVKTRSNEKEFLELFIPSYKTPSSLKTSENISTLIQTYLFPPPNIEINMPILEISIAYKIFMPFLHLFSVALSTLLGFSNTFRRRNSLAFCLALFCALVCFFSLECSAILGLGSLLSPSIFLSLSVVTVLIPTFFTYLKRV